MAQDQSIDDGFQYRVSRKTKRVCFILCGTHCSTKGVFLFLRKKQGRARLFIFYLSEIFSGRHLSREEICGVYKVEKKRNIPYGEDRGGSYKLCLCDMFSCGFNAWGKWPQRGNQAKWHSAHVLIDGEHFTKVRCFRWPVTHSQRVLRPSVFVFKLALIQTFEITITIMFCPIATTGHR